MRIGIDGREFERGKITGIGRYLLNLLKFAVENGINLNTVKQFRETWLRKEAWKLKKC